MISRRLRELIVAFACCVAGPSAADQVAVRAADSAVERAFAVGDVLFVPLEIVADGDAGVFGVDLDLDGQIVRADVDHMNDCIGSVSADCLLVHDYTGDGRVTVDDQAILTAAVSTHGLPLDPPPAEWYRASVLGDGDRDGDIDLVDFRLMLDCDWSNPSEACRAAFDFGTDGVLDATDAMLMIEGLGGPGIEVRQAGSGSNYGNPFMWTGQRYELATRLYHFTARSYDPALGRFLQRDMLGALAASGAPSLSGAYGPTVSGPQFIPGEEYGDGFSLYQYVNSDPANRFDPYGLYDWFAEADDIIASMAAEKAAAAEHAFHGLGNLAIQAALSATISAAVAVVPGAGLVFAGVGVYASVKDMVQNGISWDNALAATLSLSAGYAALPGTINSVRSGLGSLNRFTGRVKGTLGGYRNAYRGQRARGAPIMGCFGAGTPVLMGDGSVKAIENVRVGDVVQCDEDPAAQDGPELAVVIDTYARVAEAVLNLTVHTELSSSMIVATPDHPFFVPTEGRYIRARDLQPATFLEDTRYLCPVVASRKLLKQPTEVYNFAVAGAHNYYIVLAGPGTGILVHNTSAMPHIVGPIPAGANVEVPYIYNTVTGRMAVGKPGNIHYQLYEQHGVGTPLGDWVGGFAKFKNGKFVDADISSGTFSGTQGMIDSALDAFRILRGS